MNVQTNPVTAFVSLVRRAAANLPHVTRLYCPRCGTVTSHRVASETSLGETVWKCERCGLMVSEP